MSKPTRILVKLRPGVALAAVEPKANLRPLYPIVLIAQMLCPRVPLARFDVPTQSSQCAAELRLQTGQGL